MDLSPPPPVETEFACSKCGKCLRNNAGLKSHEKTCKGTGTPAKPAMPVSNLPDAVAEALRTARERDGANIVGPDPTLVLSDAGGPKNGDRPERGAPPVSDPFAELGLYETNARFPFSYERPGGSRHIYWRSYFGARIIIDAAPRRNPALEAEVARKVDELAAYNALEPDARRAIYPRFEGETVGYFALVRGEPFPAGALARARAGEVVGLLKRAGIPEA